MGDIGQSRRSPPRSEPTTQTAIPSGGESMTQADYAKRVVRSTLSNPDILIHECSVDGCDPDFIGMTAVDYAEHLVTEHKTELADDPPTSGILISILDYVERARLAAEDDAEQRGTPSGSGSGSDFWSHPGDIDG